MPPLLLLRRLTTAACFVAGFLVITPVGRSEFDLFLDGTISPTARTVNVGSSISINAREPGESFQWYHNDAPLAGATSSTLVLPNLSESHTGNYHLERVRLGLFERSQSVTLNVLPLPHGAVDTSFSSEFPLSSIVLKLQSGAEGALLIDSLNGWTRLHADGTLDHTFDGGNRSDRRFLRELPSGDRFYSTAPYRVRADGSAAPLQLPPSAPPELYFVEAQADGKIYIGSVEAIPGIPQQSEFYFARMNSDGIPDPTFTLDPSFPEPIWAISQVQTDSHARIYCTIYQIGDQDQPRALLARFTSDGTWDPTFAIYAKTAFVEAHLLPDDRLLVWEHGVDTARWFRLNSDGREDSEWSTDMNQPGAVDVGNGRIFVAHPGVIERYDITPSSLSKVPGFYQGDGEAHMVHVSPSGELYAVGTSSHWDSHMTPGIARLKGDNVVAAVPPVVTLETSPTSPYLDDRGMPHVQRGTSVVLTGAISGEGPGQFEWLALDGQPLPADRTSARLQIEAVTRETVGRYQLRANTPAGYFLSQVVHVALDRRPFLAALSGRAFVGAGENVAIAGIVGASGNVLMRGVGPGLAKQGVVGVLEDPVITRFGDDQISDFENNNWQASEALMQFSARAGAFPLATGSHDAAMLLGSWERVSTVALTGGNTTGVGLLEVYIDPSIDTTESGGPLGLAFRARTAPGEATAIAGFVIHDPIDGHIGRERTAVIRVLGPALATQGVAEPLSDPQLVLFNAYGTAIASNDNWSEDENHSWLAATTRALGLTELPAGSRDAAIVRDLGPGIYTLHATGGTGVALLEIYLAP